MLKVTIKFTDKAIFLAKMLQQRGKDEQIISRADKLLTAPLSFSLPLHLPLPISGLLP